MHCGLHSRTIVKFLMWCRRCIRLAIFDLLSDWVQADDSNELLTCWVSLTDVCIDSGSSAGGMPTSAVSQLILVHLGVCSSKLMHQFASKMRECLQYSILP